MQIRHWDEDDETEFLLIADSKNQATINCTAETVSNKKGLEGEVMKMRSGGKKGGILRWALRHTFPIFSN